jgi:glycosyltransferase involved in cell wall biosynthesis
VAVRCIDVDARLGPPRGGVVVCVLADQTATKLSDCLRAVAEHTAPEVPILVCDRSAERRALESIRGLERAGRELFYLGVDRDAAHGALNAAAPADVVLLSADCIVAEDWLVGLREAAGADSRVATASALSVGPTADLATAAAAVRTRSLRLRPRLAAADGPCIYVRRPALELVGGFDPSSRRELGAFSGRCSRSGLAHVLADDVLVHDQGRSTLTDEQHGRGPLTRALGCARRALARPSVVIDAGILSDPATGTQVQVLELIAALARTEELRLTAIVPTDTGADGARRLEELPGVTLLTHAEASREAQRRRADVVHRPFQINNAGDLTFLAGLGDRLVITHQDLINYFTPSYFPSPEAWERYRQLTRGVLAIADRVLFFSAHAREDALAEELVEPHRATVVRLGVDHRIVAAGLKALRPSGAARLEDGAEVMLCIGTNFHHKNRVFALRVLEQLQRQHDWTGYLVFAGPPVSAGSSRAEEARLLESDRRLAQSVLDCGPVTEYQKAWLLRRARLVVYPTVHEGFGLVPFEAAEQGVPCMWAAGTSLSELLPDSQASIVAWDAEQSATHALELMHDEELRQRNIEAICQVGAGLTWDDTAARLIEVYTATCDSPATPASELERRQGRIAGTFSEDAMRLVGPGGALPTGVERPLLALATHPRIGEPLFGALKLGYRVSYKLRRRGGGTRAVPMRADDDQRS